jgi:hypothetical protein
MILDDDVILGEIPAMGEHIRGIQVELSETIAFQRSPLYRRMWRRVRGRAFRDGWIFNLIMMVNSRLELVRIRSVISSFEEGS